MNLFQSLSIKKATAFAGLFFILAQFSALAQTATSFGAEGDSAYSAKNFPLAIQYYRKQASLQRLSFAKKDIYYNIACCYSLSGDKKNAWEYLHKSMSAGFNDYAHILVDTDLDTLHHDNEWGRFSELNKAFQQKMSDPLKAEFVTDDIHNFWEAYARVQKDTARAIELYTIYYFEKASPGLQDYYNSRIFSVENFVANQKKKPAFYRAIRQNTLKVDNFKAQIQQSFVKLKQLYEGAVFPNVYFVIGRWNSAGTVSGNGLLIGTDMMSKSAEVPLDELTTWEKNNYQSIDNVPIIVAHELIHSQQNNMKQDTTTLAACISEGMADFLGQLISGKIINERLVSYANGKEKQIWADFEKDMDLNHVNNWLYNSEQETADRPADLGYWVGYQICKSFYDERPEKKQAIYDMLHIKDYKAFLTESRYKEKLGL